MSKKITSPTFSLCYTFNNYTDDDYKSLQDYDNYVYHVCGKEVGDSGTHHLQGYIEFKKSIRPESFRKKISKRSFHTELRKGTPQQASNYCLKGSGTVEQPSQFDGFVKGNLLPKQPGKRNDLIEFRNAIKVNPNLDVIEEFPEIQAKYHKFVAACQQKYKQARNKMTAIIWIYGSTGTRKSYLSRLIAEWDNKSIYTKPPGVWFEGYNNEDVMILEDFRSNHMSFDELLRHADRYDLTVPVKGGSAKFTSSLIIVNTPLNPEETFKDSMLNQGSINQLKRRILLCYNTTKYYDEETKSDIRPIETWHFENDIKYLEQTDTVEEMIAYKLDIEKRRLAIKQSFEEYTNSLI